MSAVTATILFTDLVDSTQLMSDLGEDAAEALRREHFGLLRSAIAETGGREVKNLGDGLMVAFDGIGAAMACAVAMQQAISSRPPTLAPLAIRIGVAVGEAEHEDGDYFGLPVVQAARLCAKAAGGEILVTDLARLLAGSRGGFDLEPVGALELKGLDEPVEAHRLRWQARPAAAQPPLPARLDAARAATFVGREAEDERLRLAWKAAVAGERRVALLAGEPGIGKTTLAGRLATDVHDEGAIVLYGRSDEDLGVPYQPWIEALGHLVGHLPDEVLADHVADRGPSLVRLVPELGRRTGAEASAQIDGDAERFILFGCVADLLERASRVRPVLLVLDDLHWADRPTTQLLRHLVTNVVAAAIAVVGTYRDSEVASGDPASELLAVLHREQGVDRVALRGLSDADLLEMLERIAGHELDDAGVALRDAVLEETAGNPFFVGEVLRHLVESGSLVQDASGRWVAGGDVLAAGLPVSVKEVIAQRVARLGPSTERLLTFASVIGRDFEVALLAAVADVTDDEVLDACDAATAAAVLRTTDDPERYTFNHALIEHTLYDSLSAARRTRAHRAVAEAIEELVGDDSGERAGELAFHWSRAVAPTDGDKAARYAQVAGDRALALLAPDEALRWYSQALELVGSSATAEDRRSIELLVGLGDAQRQVGVPDYRDTLLQASRLADAGGHIDVLVAAVLANNRGMLSASHEVDADRVAMIDRALDRLDDDRLADRARLLSLACLERIYGGEFDLRVQLAEEAVAAARGSGEADVLASTIVFCSDGIFSPSTVGVRRRWFEEAATLDPASLRPATRYLLHNNRRFSSIEWCDGVGVREGEEAAAEAIERVPHASLQWNHAFHLVWPEILWGRLDEAERLLDRSFELGVANDEPDVMVIYGSQLMLLRDFGGRLEEIFPLIVETHTAAPEIAGYRGLYAWACASSGRMEQAVGMLDAELAGGFAIPPDYSWLLTHSLWADAAAACGHRAAATLLRERMLPFAELVVSAAVATRLPVAHYLGRLEHSLGNLDGAHDWFQRALEIDERLESRLYVAHTQAAWAALLVERDEGDDRERARAMAEDALASAVAGGLVAVARDARNVLARLGDEGGVGAVVG